PLGLLLVEEVRKKDWLTEIDRDLAEAVAQIAQDLEQAQDRFLFLHLTAQPAQIAALFQNLLIAHVDRNENDGLAMIPQKAAQGHGDHATLGRQRAAGPAAPAFDEVFHRIAPGQHRVHVLVENGGIQLILAETAAHEEGTA